MYDLILRGARVVDVDGVASVEVAIRDGVIAALLPRGAEGEAQTTIDLTGKLLFPGLVDAHVHLREPGLEHKEDFESGTRAAAAGGVTTLLVMPTDEPWTVTEAHLLQKFALAAGRIHVDVAFQTAVPKENIDLAALRRLGAVSMEVFTADVPEAFRHETLDDLVTVLARIAATGALAGISPGDQSILMQAFGSDAAAFAASRPPIAEAAGISKAVLAAAKTGVRAHIRQSNSALGVETFRRLKSMADVSIETTVQNLIFTESDYLRLGPLIKASPPFRQASDVEALRVSVREGVVDIVATDHAPHSPAEKRAPQARFDDIPGGMAGVQTLLPVMLHLVDAGVLGLADIVRLCAANPAERFGLGRRKGRIAPGRDADCVVVDPAATMGIRSEDQYSKAGFTPFDGLSVPYRVMQVFLRGREIANDGKASGVATGVALREV